MSWESREGARWYPGRDKEEVAVEEPHTRVLFLFLLPGCQPLITASLHVHLSLEGMKRHLPGQRVDTELQRAQGSSLGAGSISCCRAGANPGAAGIPKRSPPSALEVNWPGPQDGPELVKGRNWVGGDTNAPWEVAVDGSSASGHLILQIQFELWASGSKLAQFWQIWAFGV